MQTRRAVFLAGYGLTAVSMVSRNGIVDFVLREWLLFASAVSLLVTSIYSRHIPEYSRRELQILFILFVLFVAVKGLQRSGLIARISQAIETGRAIPLKLVVATFFLSMIVTNDVALIVIVPVTLLTRVERKDILVILEALAANAGSALTPLGNPQNLFLYWFYELQPLAFVETIFPFALVCLLGLVVAALFIRSPLPARAVVAVPINRSAGMYVGSLILVLLIVLHVLPVSAGLLVIVPVWLLDRQALRIDYALLLTFFLFFGLAENMKSILAVEISHSGHIFLFSALASQVISNVPATLLFAKFTANWQALLWGVNTGGFGSLFGSLANLIAYRLYVNHDSTRDPAAFTLRFLVIGYVAFFVCLGLYSVLYLTG